MTQPVGKAFVLGAGLGTRLRPLTNLLPKPLLPIFGKPLVTFAFDHLLHFGVSELWVNTHHLPERFTRHFQNPEYRGASLTLVHEAELLETGGGIKNLEEKIGNAHFIVYSGDILTDLPIERLVEEHFSRRNDVTLALRKTKFSSSVHWSDQSRRVVDINNALGTGAKSQFDFAGISIWSPSVFQRIPKETKISFVAILIEWIRQEGKIGGIPLQEGSWFNIGSSKEYIDAHKSIFQQNWVPYYLQPGNIWPLRVDPLAEVSVNARVEGGSHVAARCRVADAVLVEDSILLPDTALIEETRLHSCVVSGTSLRPGEYRDSILL